MTIVFILDVLKINQKYINSFYNKQPQNYFPITVHLLNEPINRYLYIYSFKKRECNNYIPFIDKLTLNHENCNSITIDMSLKSRLYAI